MSDSELYKLLQDLTVKKLEKQIRSKRRLLNRLRAEIALKTAFTGLTVDEVEEMLGC